MEDDLKKKWKTNQSTKINLIGCDTIVNSPSIIHYKQVRESTPYQGTTLGFRTINSK